MDNPIFLYPFIVKEVYLDSLSHMNNATYLTLFEEARWDFITKNGYGLKKIHETKQSPVILQINIQFHKELRLREEIVIQSQTLSYKGKIGTLLQKMIRGEEVCCTAEFLFGLFDLKERKLILPTPEWIKAISFQPE